jgi:hypothetical protein
MIGSIKPREFSRFRMLVILQFSQAFADVRPRQRDFSEDLDAVSPLLIRGWENIAVVHGWLLE